MGEVFGINGAIEAPAGTTEEEFNTKLLGFFESQGWKFGGGTWRYENIDEEDS